jgi:DNA processing protein
MDKNTELTIWISSIPGIGAIKANKLLSYFKSPEEVFWADEVALFQTGFLSRNDVLNILDKKHKENLYLLLEKIYKSDISVVSIKDEKYPGYLKNIYDPPPVLFYKGEIKKEENALAIVGSRKATSYGIKMSEVIADSLGQMGFTIISGMARGIDAAAHEACLKAGSRTIAVLGCGVDVVYPPESRGLMNRIIEQGTVISEFIPGTQPLAYNFPQRNRIISGLSLGIIVIEAGEKSGSLITAHIALEQGREVFALPGNVSSSKSAGTNKLIRDGAKIITGIEDIVDELQILNIDKKKEYLNRKINNKTMNALGNDEKKVIMELESGEIHIDELSRKTGFDIKKLSSLLVVLEMGGLLEQLPGKKYRLIII